MPSGSYHYKLLSTRLVNDRRRIDTGPRVELPQQAAVACVAGGKLTIAFSHKHQSPRARRYPSYQGFIGLYLPLNLSGGGIDALNLPVPDSSALVATT